MKKILAMVLAMILILSASAFAEEAVIGRLSMIGMSKEDAEKMAEAHQGDQLDAGIAGYAGSMFSALDNQLEYDNLTTLLMALNADDITHIGVTSTVARYIAAHNDHLKWEENDLPIQDTYCMMVMEENRDIFDLLNNAIVEMKADGTLDSLIENELQAYIDSDPAPIDMPEFKGAQTIRVAVTGDLPPMDFVAVDGVPAGFNVALLAEIAKRAQVNFEITQVDSAARSTALGTGRVDAIFWIKGVASATGDILWSEAVPGALSTEIYFSDSFARVSKK